MGVKKAEIHIVETFLRVQTQIHIQYPSNCYPQHFIPLFSWENSTKGQLPGPQTWASTILSYLLTFCLSFKAWASCVATVFFLLHDF